MSIQSCEAGSYWYLEGRDTLVTWQPMTSGELVLEYEATFTTLGIDDADGAFEADDVDIPADFEDMMIEYCLWKLHARHEESLRRSILHHQDYKEAVIDARAYSNRAPHGRGYYRGTDM